MTRLILLRSRRRRRGPFLVVCHPGAFLSPVVVSVRAGVIVDACRCRVAAWPDGALDHDVRGEAGEVELRAAATMATRRRRLKVARPTIGDKTTGQAGVTKVALLLLLCRSSCTVACCATTASEATSATVFCPAQGCANRLLASSALFEEQIRPDHGAPARCATHLADL